MYRDLGFLRVWGGLGDRAQGASYAYLIYPHKPIVAYLPQTGEMLNEYCVAFPDHSRPYGSARLPDSDDVLAKSCTAPRLTQPLTMSTRHATTAPRKPCPLRWSLMQPPSAVWRRR